MLTADGPRGHRTEKRNLSILSTACNRMAAVCRRVSKRQHPQARQRLRGLRTLLSGYRRVKPATRRRAAAAAGCGRGLARNCEPDEHAAGTTRHSNLVDRSTGLCDTVGTPSDTHGRAQWSSRQSPVGVSIQPSPVPLSRYSKIHTRICLALPDSSAYE